MTLMKNNRRDSYYQGEIYNPFKDGNASADVPLLVEGGWTSNAYVGRKLFAKDQIEYFDPENDFTVPAANYITKIFNISLSSINTLRIISDMDISGIEYTIYQASFLERPNNDITTTTYWHDTTLYPKTVTMTVDATTGKYHFVDIVNFIALPYVFFVISKLDTIPYVAGNNLLMYLHTELSP